VSGSEVLLSRQLNYPSAEFPAPPSIGFCVPTGWIPAAVAGAVAAARLEVHTDSFAPNLVVTAETALEDVASIYDSQSKAIDGLRAVAKLDELNVKIRNVAWRVWEYAFEDRRAGTLVQLVATTVVGGFVVSVVGSVSADQAEEQLPNLRAILQSMSIPISRAQSSVTETI
jgi:hypothetical protein